MKHPGKTWGSGDMTKCNCTRSCARRTVGSGCGSEGPAKAGVGAGTGARAGTGAGARGGTGSATVAGAGPRAGAGSGARTGAQAGEGAGAVVVAGSPWAGARSPAGSWSPAEVAAGTTPAHELGAGFSSSDSGAAVRGEKLTLLPASPCAFAGTEPSPGVPREATARKEPSPGRLPDCSPRTGCSEPGPCFWTHTSLWGLFPVGLAPTHPHIPHAPSLRLLTLRFGLRGLCLLDRTH